MKNKFFFSMLVTTLCIVNMLSAKNITPIVYGLNSFGEIYANVNGAWIKGPALPNGRTIGEIAAGPSATKSDGTQQGQLYAIDAAHALWSMPEASVAKPFGNNQWQSINSPQLVNIAVGKEQLIGSLYQKVSYFDLYKQPLATKGVFDTNWTIDTKTDTSFVAISPDVPATAFHLVERYNFLTSKLEYKPFYAQLGKTGWIEIGFQFRKIYAGAEGSCIGINQAGQMYANQQVFDPQSTWIELLPPQLTSITTIENPNDADQWNLTSAQGELAFGLTTDGAGQVINEIMMNTRIYCQNKKDPAKNIVKNALWRRTKINTINRFGSGWELVLLNSINKDPWEPLSFHSLEAPGVIIALAIGSFDQKVAKAEKDEQEKQRKAKKTAKKREEIAKRAKTAEKRKRQMSPGTRQITHGSMK